MCKKKIGKIFKIISLGLGILVAVFTLILHSISIWPAAKKVIFPNENIEVLGFKSNQRIIITNTGDFDLFISHVHFGANDFPYEDIFKELLAVANDKPIENINLDSIDVDMFDTNQDIGEIIEAGKIRKFNFDIDVPENLSFVHKENEERWERLILIAGANKNSSLIRPVFFSANDRRYEQIQRNYDNKLNIFEGQGVVYAYSSRLKKEITFPFKILGTVAYNKSGEFNDRLEKWLNPRTGHPEDLK